MLEISGGLDLREKPFGTDDRGELRTQNLDRNLAVVLQVQGEVYSRHATLADLAVDTVTLGECGLQANGPECRVCHGRQTCGTPVVTSMATLAGAVAGPCGVMTGHISSDVEEPARRGADGSNHPPA